MPSIVGGSTTPRYLVRRLFSTCLTATVFSSVTAQVAADTGAPAVMEVERQAQALVADTERIIESEELTGWFTDTEAYRSVRPTLLESVCRALPEARERASELLRERARSHGDPRQLFALYGDVTSEVRAARAAGRERDAFAQVLRDVGDCPFW
ncbi:MAG TPA: hypothetical protein PKD61_34855, partial [Polyangiaceae bacterium]|nr:hypothetical protein [Polyangiaceae bacterium]